MDLLNFLKKSEEARKVFGKRELKIIEKQLLGINLTQSEKNRLSRDIRKKFRFAREIAKFEDEFDLKKASRVKKIINQALEEILNHPLEKNIKRILLFGSVVKNEISVRSDIDIAVEFDKITQKESFNFRKRIMGQIPGKVDVQVFNFLPKKIIKEINKNHRILYSK